MKKITFLLLCLVSCAVCTTAQSTYTLQQLKDSALRNNIAIRQGQLNISSATQQRKEAFTKYFPTVSGNGVWFNANKGMAQTSVNLTEVVPPEVALSLAGSLPVEALVAMANPIEVSMLKNGTIAGITAVQPVFAGTQIINGNKLARVGEEASQLKLQLSENEVEKQTEQYYWQIISLQEKLNTLNVVDSLLADIHKDVKVAIEAGVAMPNDMLQVQLRQNEMASNRLKVENGISILKLVLAQYCGLKSDKFIVKSDVTADVPALAAEANSSFFTSSLNGLPEYQLLSMQVKARKLEQRMEFGKLLPTVAVGAGYNYHNLLDRDHSFGMIFATVSLPISDWWGGSHAVQRKKIEYQKALDEQQDKSELLQIRMQKSYNDVCEAVKQVEIAQRSIEQAKENLRLNRDYYNAGTSRMADLLEAQMLYQQARDQHTDAIAEYHNKLLEYRQATGAHHYQ